MGLVCARCSDVTKASGAGAPLDPEVEGSEGSEAESEDGRSEVAASSEEDDNQEEYKQGVEEILKSTSKSLKRGKTMAMKEAISTAKKYNIEAKTVAEAEKRLDDHKRQQRREEVEKEADAFLASANNERAACEKVLKKVIEADCRKEVIDRVQDKLDEIIATRDLEDEEAEQAREYLKQSCRDFVLAATQGGGRPVLLVDLEDGKKVPSLLSLDAPLQCLLLRREEVDEAESKAVPLRSVTAGLARGDKKVAATKGFGQLEDEDGECAVALRFEVDRVSGVWCFVEPTQARRDRLLEALVVLTAICG